MTYQRFNYPQNNTLQLQSVGHVLGTPAGELKVGDSLMWNFGSTSTVEKIVKQTAKTIWISEKYEDGKSYERRLLKTRLVCRLSK